MEQGLDLISETSETSGTSESSEKSMKTQIQDLPHITFQELLSLWFFYSIHLG